MFLSNFIRRNLVTLVLLFIVIFLLISGKNKNLVSTSVAPMAGRASLDMVESKIGGFSGTVSEQFMPPSEPAPVITPNRLVIQESYLSLLVKDVTTVRDQIISYAQNQKGYMVSSEISNPQDAPTATVIVRIPGDKLEDALVFLRSLAVKVVSENLSGYDVTDQYVDIEKQIAILENTIAKFQSILDQAIEISDITNLTQQIISYQNQIDSYKGQQEALKQKSSLAKITVYLSTDEIALPYAPSEVWRPNVIFKLAVRSLVGNLRKIGTLIIWLVVYAVIWIPIVIIYYLVKKKLVDRK